MSRHDSFLANRTEPSAPGSTQPFAVTAVSIANRQSMPQVAAVVDRLRAVFGPVRVIYAEENGCELGKPPDPGVIAYPSHIPTKRKGGRS